RGRPGIFRKAVGQYVDVPPCDLGARLLVLSYTVYLQGDKATCGFPIDQMGRRDPVDPGFQGISQGLDPVVVPLVLFEGLLGLWIVLQVDQPAPSSLIIDPGTPSPFGRVDLNLVAVYPALLVLGKAVAPDLYPGVHGGIHLVF